MRKNTTWGMIEEYWWLFLVVIGLAIGGPWVYEKYIADKSPYSFDPPDSSKELDDETERFIFEFEAKDDLSNVSVEWIVEDENEDRQESNRKDIGNLRKDGEVEIFIDVKVGDDHGERPEKLYFNITLRFNSEMKEKPEKYELDQHIPNKGRYKKK